MTRALWFLAEIFAGVMMAGALTAVAVPVIMREGWSPLPLAGWLTLAVSVVLCVVIGERLRRRRQRYRLP